jgi:hypothetical protein
MNKETISPAYKHFLSFFKLTQRERLDGLDASYFSELTPEEKYNAFEYLKDKFDISTESIRGLYLCDSEKAIALFKETITSPLKPRKNSWENEAAFMGRVMMSGYICNVEPTKENIDYLADFDIFDKNGDIRSTLYKLLPSKPTTKRAINFLEKAVLFENVDDFPSGSAIDTYLSTYGFEFDMNDKNYLKIFKNLLSDDIEERKSTIEKIKLSYSPSYAN